MSEIKENKVNVMSQRLHWLRNQLVRVKIEGEVFDGTYVDMMRLGQAYFFIFNVCSKAKMVESTKVISISQL
jgi:hypothetical protein